MAKIIDWFPKIIFCAIPEIIMLMIPNEELSIGSYQILTFYYYFTSISMNKIQDSLS